jgi:hypothetical protein
MKYPNNDRQVLRKLERIQSRLLDKFGLESTIDTDVSDECDPTLVVSRVVTNPRTNRTGIVEIAFYGSAMRQPNSPVFTKVRDIATFLAGAYDSGLAIAMNHKTEFEVTYDPQAPLGLNTEAYAGNIEMLRINEAVLDNAPDSYHALRTLRDRLAMNKDRRFTVSLEDSKLVFRSM